MLGNGCGLEYMDIGGSTYTNVPLPTRIGGVPATRREVESRRLDTDIVLRYPAKLHDMGELGFMYEYERTVFNALQTIFLSLPSACIKNWRITLENGERFIVQGYLVTHRKTDSESEAIEMVECSIRITTKFTAVSAPA